MKASPGKNEIGKFLSTAAKNAGLQQEDIDIDIDILYLTWTSTHLAVR